MVEPGARSGFVLPAGAEIEIDWRVAELTISEVVLVALELAKLKEAVTLAVPWLTPSATPMLLPGAPNFATAELSEVHVTEVLMS